MSKTFDSVLSGFRELGLKKLEELDKLCDDNRSWLVSAVADVKRQIAEAGPAAKKQRVGPNPADVVTTHPAEVGALL